MLWCRIAPSPARIVQINESNATVALLGSAQCTQGLAETNQIRKAYTDKVKLNVGFCHQTKYFSVDLQGCVFEMQHPYIRTKHL